MARLFRLAAKTIYRGIVSILPDYLAIQLMYLRYFGRFAKLKNPRTYNEKINWRKLYQRDPRFCLFGDKVLVKDEIAKIVGKEHIIPTLWVGAKPEEIPFDILTPPYVIKTNHNYDATIFIHKYEDIDLATICETMNAKLLESYDKVSREWGYRDIPRRVLVESMLKSLDGKIPDDYKFLVYHGRVHFILVEYDRLGTLRDSYYDCDWHLLPAQLERVPGIGFPLPRPTRLDEMIAVAEKIGALFDQVRVDLYQTSEGVFFGETTFYDGAGFDKFTKEEWDIKIGEPWHIRSCRVKGRPSKMGGNSLASGERSGRCLFPE